MTSDIQITEEAGIIPADNPVLRYIEDVTVNRGYEVKAFSEGPEAEAWLRSAL